MGLVPLALALACSGRGNVNDDTGAFPPVPEPGPREADPGPNLFRPDLGATTVPALRVPPIFGGTLLSTGDGKLAVAADPDRGQIYVVDLVKRALASTVDVGAGSLPFRGVESRPGIVHFTLRGSGQVVTLDATAGSVLWTAAACPEPRGIDYDAATETVAVACERGDVVSLRTVDGVIARTVHTPVTSARDVFVEGEGYWISDFRSADLYLVDAQGVVRRVAHSGDVLTPTDFAWRTRRLGPSTFLVSHQTILSTAPVSTTATGAYGGASPDPTCVPNDSMIGTAVTRIEVAKPSIMTRVPGGALPVDVAYEPVMQSFALAFAGNSWQPKLQKVQLFHANSGVVLACPPNPAPIVGEIVAVEYTSTGALLEQSREPALLHVTAGITRETIELSPISRRDTGSILFHANSGRHVACASCHAEGADDGRTWLFDDGKIGPVRKRRTPSLRGTVLGTAPYHWNGEEHDLSALFTDVLSHRMDGPSLDAAQAVAFASWLEQLPAPRRSPADDPDVMRGASLFAGKGKCTSCHGTGGATPSSALFDVGTGAELSPPSLVGVSVRVPLMHDGCADTLSRRFDPSCGGSDHGGALSADETGAIVAYLRSL